MPLNLLSEITHTRLLITNPPPLELGYLLQSTMGERPKCWVKINLHKGISRVKPCDNSNSPGRAGRSHALASMLSQEVKRAVPGNSRTSRSHTNYHTCRAVHTCQPHSELGQPEPGFGSRRHSCSLRMPTENTLFDSLPNKGQKLLGSMHRFKYANLLPTIPEEPVWILSL